MGDELPAAYSLQPAEGDALAYSEGFTGKGVATYTNGDVFDGEFVDGKKQGAGKYTHLDGAVYDGAYDADVRSGLGRLTYASGDVYHGHFANGAQEGEGSCLYANKDVYCGSWKGGKKHGEGFYVFNTSKYQYKGTWEEGKIGSGTWQLSKGYKYVGGFAGQKPCGDGKWCFQGFDVVGSYSQETKPVDSSDNNAVETKIYWETAAIVENNMPN